VCASVYTTNDFGTSVRNSRHYGYMHESARLKSMEVIPGDEKGTEQGGDYADSESDDRREDDRT
jgi:hypothetical protein